MWVKRTDREPQKRGIYTVFGTVNKETPYECKERFTARYVPESESFCDQSGEDLIGIDDSVEYWFDFSEIEDPE